MSHKLVIDFELVNQNEIKRESWVAAIWHLLGVVNFQNAKELHDRNVPKGFVWNVTRRGETTYCMTFSSIRPKLVEMLKTGAETQMKSGKAFTLSDDVILKIKNITEVDDYFIKSSLIRLSPITGIILDRRIKVKKSKLHGDNPNRSKLVPMNPFDDRIDFEKRLKNNLILKLKTLSDLEYSPDNIRLRIISSGEEKDMAFREVPLRGHYCSVQINAPKPVLEMALYAGLGRMNGLGFGMMTPMTKEKLHESMREKEYER